MACLNQAAVVESHNRTPNAAGSNGAPGGRLLQHLPIGWPASHGIHRSLHILQLGICSGNSQSH